MKHKKKIDELYRDGLRNAETPPPPESWEIISSRLDQKQKKKLLPLWMKWGAVAAVLALLVTVFNFALFDTPLPDPVVQEDENPALIESPASEITPEAETRFTDAQNTDENDSSGSFSSEKIASEAASAVPEAKSEGVTEEKFNPSEKSRPEATLIAENASEKEISEKNIIRNAPQLSNSAEALAETSKTSEKQENSVISEAKKNQIEKELFKEETELADVPPKNEHFLKRFSISTNAGAVLFDMGNSNTVDEQFANNPGGSEVSMTYGVNVAYEISDKLKIRSGVNKMNFNYSTRQVDYAAAMNSSAVNAEPMARAMSLVIAAQGDVDQKFGFIEVPMELEFNLIDKKFGLNLIGGASTLFLEENNISMTTAAYTTDLGEAQNLNRLSFSANLGLGVNYEFAPKLRINLEPLFKYQLKTFNHSNSYTFGIYSGLSYQF